MTRKHFEAIAQSVKISFNNAIRGATEESAKDIRLLRKELVENLCLDFKRENSNFKREKFEEACGIE